jgi:hypothetical protein
MLHVARGLLLLLLMGCSQVETALALACEAPAARSAAASLPAHADHTPCPPSHGNRRQSGSDEGRSHDDPGCAAMLACNASLALPGAPPVTPRTTVALAPPITNLLPPPSRAEPPSSPPPRA